MTRTEALCFVMRMTAEQGNWFRGKPPLDPDAKNRLAVLDAFLECIPARTPDEPVFERLTRPVDRSRLAAFREATLPRTTAWVRQQFSLAQRPFQRTVPQPPQKPRPSAQEALAWVALVERLAQGHAVPAQELERLALGFDQLLEVWSDEVFRDAENGRCPDCGEGWIYELDAAQHVGACREHPAMLRLRAVQLTARLRSVALPPALTSLSLPVEVRSSYGDRWEVRGALHRLIYPDGTQPPHRMASSAALVARVGREWAHHVDRTSDPCPWCGDVFPLAEFHAHLRACDHHPAAQLTAIARALAPELEGLTNLVQRRLAARKELELLSQATERFDADMGWCEDGPYSDQYSEAPWRAAFARAKQYLGAGDRGRRAWTPRASPLRAAMACLLADEAPAQAQRTAMETVRAAVAQYDGWTAKLTFGTTCPACARSGVPRLSLADHLRECPLHPTVKKHRAALALAALQGGPPPLPLRLGFLDTRSYPDGSVDYLRRERDSALQRLFEFHVSELSQRERDDLGRFVDAWEELSELAAPRPCPWCGLDDANEAHLLSCSQHPARGAEATASSQLEALAVRWVLEADACEVRLAHLHEACNAYWNGMRDGEDGKSIANDAIEEMWKPPRQKAKDTLAAIPAQLG